MLRARKNNGVMPNPRQVASEGKRSPSSKSCASYLKEDLVSRRFFRPLEKWRIPDVGLGLKLWARVSARTQQSETRPWTATVSTPVPSRCQAEGTPPHEDISKYYYYVLTKIPLFSFRDLAASCKLVAS
mgnify:CR=1 FL=1